MSGVKRGGWLEVWAREGAVQAARAASESRKEVHEGRCTGMMRSLWKGVGNDGVGKRRGERAKQFGVVGREQGGSENELGRE